MDDDTFLSFVFGLHQRVISVYYANGQRIPGKYCENGCIPSYRGVPTSWRRTKKYDRLFVRVDDAYPNIIHIEHRGHVFQVDKATWAMFRPNILLMKGEEEI